MHQVAGEGHVLPINCADERNTARRVPRRRQNCQRIRPPGERFVVIEHGIDGQIPTDGEECVSVVVVVVDTFLLPVLLGVFEMRQLEPRSRQPCAARHQVARTETLVTVMMCKQHPIDVADPDFIYPLTNLAAAAVDQQCAILVSEHVNVARVLKQMKMRRDRMKLWHR